MERKEYSAGGVKFGFWFVEFRKTINLLAQGTDFDEIRRLCTEENLYATATPARGKQIYSTVSSRITSLDSSIYPLFLDSDLSTQKLINLIAAMASDMLFFDFVYEVVREKLIIGINEISNSDYNVFFKEKALQNDKVAGWTDITFSRLARYYKVMLYEAGVTNKTSETRQIYKPILDPTLQRWLEDHDMGIMVKALTGVR